MPLISQTISNMIGGISQQAPTIRLEGQCEDSYNGVMSLVEGWKKRKGTKHIAKLFSTDCTGMNFHISDNYVFTIKDGTIKVFDLTGNAEAININASDDYLDAANNPKLKINTIADTTFVLNSAKVPGMSTTLSTNPYEGKAIVHVKQVNWDTTYKILNSDGVVIATCTSPDGVVDPNIESTDPTYTDEQDDADPKWMDFSYIASNLASQITGAIFKKTTILLPNDTYSVEDSMNGQYLVYIKNKVAAFSDLPIVAPNGYMVEIDNGSSSSSGNYWVKAVTKDGSDFGDCFWEETIAPGISYQIDKTTMPHIIMYDTTTGEFTYKQAPWEDRMVGDTLTNPVPTFIGKKINDLFYYKNRLGILADENCIMSRASEPYAFFFSTVQTLADNEPIDVAGSHTEVVILKHALPLSEQLYFFGQKAEFALNEGDNILSPKTASIDTLTEYACDTSVAPVSSGKSIFFLSKNANWESVYEGLINDTTDRFMAASVTTHVPALIPKNPIAISASPNAETLVMISEADQSVIYLYKYSWLNAEKVQSAWSRLQLQGKVQHFQFIDTTLYLCIQYDDGLYLESIDFDDGNLEETVCLDRRLIKEEISSSYVYPYTTITLPYAITSSNCPVVVLDDGQELEAAYLSDTSIQITGNYEGSIAYVGWKYTARLIPSEPIYIPTGRKTALVEGRLQLRQYHVIFSNAEDFIVKVVPKYRTLYKYEGDSVVAFSNPANMPDASTLAQGSFISRHHNIIGSGETILGENYTSSGKFSIPIMSRSNQVSIAIESEALKPLCIISAGWEGYYVCRNTPA